MIAVGILVVYGVLLWVVYLLVKKKINYWNTDNFILAGKNVEAWRLTPSIFNSWIWTTTIMGAAEAAIFYGFSGGLAYGLGAGLAFLALIGIIIVFKRLMPEAIFITDFIGGRFSENARSIYYILSVLMVIYITVEMAAGVGFVFNGLFGVSFKNIAFISVAIAVIFANFAGMRGALYNDLINFLIIVIGFGILVHIVIDKFDTQMLYEGLLDVRGNPENINYNSSMLNYFVWGGVRYFISAIIVALAQITVDPAYYLKAYIAKDEKTIVRSFVLGGFFLFVPIAILSSIILGFSALALKFDLGQVENFSILLSSKMLLLNFGPGAHILMASVMLSVAVTTMISEFMGIMGLSTLGIYESRVNKAGTEREKLIFGRVFTIFIGMICALIAISLEKVSLLNIDIFCGILFAASCATLIMGLCSKKSFGKLAVLAVLLGVATGLTIWILTFDLRIGLFCATVTSFLFPILFLSIVGFFIRRDFNFYSLKFKK